MSGEAAGVLTAPDVEHAIDPGAGEVLLVFVDPESDAGARLVAAISPPLRWITPAERDLLVRESDPGAIVGAEGAAWTARAIEILGGAQPSARRRVHPRVRKLLRLLAADPREDGASLETLAAVVGLSPSRLMHVFTESLGIPLRPYLAWLRLQRAAHAITAGLSLAEAAHAAGFADAAHMTRTFRKMFGVTPSSLRPPRATPDESRRSARTEGT
jgi:AraC-like DNA-binding protein